jgi:hypothetical protein
MSPSPGLTSESVCYKSYYQIKSGKKRRNLEQLKQTRGRRQCGGWSAQAAGSLGARRICRLQLCRCAARQHLQEDGDGHTRGRSALVLTSSTIAAWSRSAPSTPRFERSCAGTTARRPCRNRRSPAQDPPQEPPPAQTVDAACPRKSRRSPRRRRCPHAAHAGAADRRRTGESLFLSLDLGDAEGAEWIS